MAVPASRIAALWSRSTKLIRIFSHSYFPQELVVLASIWLLRIQLSSMITIGTLRWMNKQLTALIVLVKQSLWLYIESWPGVLSKKRSWSGRSRNRLSSLLFMATHSRWKKLYRWWWMTMLPSKFKSTALSKVSAAVELRPKSTSLPNRRVSQGKNVLRKMKSQNLKLLMSPQISTKQVRSQAAVKMMSLLLTSALKMT